jgi:hypothetical protein
VRVDLLLRLLISSAMLVVPFSLLAILAGRADGLIWLMFPVVYVPVFLVAALVAFIPVETMAGVWGWPEVPALVIAGAALGATVAVLAGARARRGRPSSGASPRGTRRPS